MPTSPTVDCLPFEELRPVFDDTVGKSLTQSMTIVTLIQY